MLRERRLLMCWFVTAMALIHQVVGDDQVGYGRHIKQGKTIKMGPGSWKIAQTNDDLKAYTDATGHNPCFDIKMEGKDM